MNIPTGLGQAAGVSASPVNASATVAAVVLVVYLCLQVWSLPIKANRSSYYA
jgi:hypothetical protein